MAYKLFTLSQMFSVLVCEEIIFSQGEKYIYQILNNFKLASQLASWLRRMLEMAIIVPFDNELSAKKEKKCWDLKPAAERV